MPSVNSPHGGVKVFTFHGVEVTSNGSNQATGTCPFCDKHKLYVNVETGQWDCKVCGSKGNATTFVRRLWEDAGATLPEDATPFQELAENRRLLDPQTLLEWGVRQSPITGDWIIPGYGADGKLNTLYRYVDVGNGRSACMATPGLNQQLHGVNLYDPDKPDVYLCEGPWDGMALWEALSCCKRTDDGEIDFTSNVTASLLGTCNVLAVPGCNVFSETWCELFAGKNVCLLYDNDHPRVHPKTRLPIPPAGLDGMRRVAQVLAKYDTPPKSLHYLEWGTTGYNADLPNGMDVRDLLTTCDDQSVDLSQRVDRVEQLLGMLKPIPQDWVGGRSKAAVKSGGTDVECLPCTQWLTLVNSWRKPLKWTDGLDRALSVMLACVTSTKAVGDQLWCKVIGPASCGKSTLCEALSVNKDYVLAKSTIRGFHSGFQSDKEGVEDNSLISQVRDKTLVTKDGDTLLQSPNLGQILSEARDLYDATSRTHYRNKMSRDYEGVRMTWLLCGTSSLRTIDSSELGERFLDCVIMEDIDPELEDEILLRVANRTERSLNFESNGQMTSQHDPDLVKAMQLTGGYVGWLRSNASRLLPKVKFSKEILQECINLGKFVAYMRARPSTRQEETAEREFAARLVSQLVRLAKCMTVVLNRDTPDEEVMRRVGHVAMDTARGRTLEIAKHLHLMGDGGSSPAAIARYTNETDDKLKVMLRFLRRIGVVESTVKHVTKGVTTRPKWKLTPRVSALYTVVCGEREPEPEDEG